LNNDNFTPEKYQTESSMNHPPNYDLFLKCIETYGPEGFTGIDPNDRLMMAFDIIRMPAKGLNSERVAEM